MLGVNRRRHSAPLPGAGGRPLGPDHGPRTTDHGPRTTDHGPGAGGARADRGRAGLERTGGHEPRFTRQGERGRDKGPGAARPGLGGIGGHGGEGIYRGMEPATGGAIGRKTGRAGAGLNRARNK